MKSVVFSKKIFYIFECLACMHVCTTCVCLLPVEVRKWALDPLKMELQIVVNHHVGAEKGAQVLCKIGTFS